MFARRLTAAAASLLPVLSVCLAANVRAQSAYPQPDPSADEQFMLERINTARANPAVEGAMLAAQNADATIQTYYNYYHVSLVELTTDFATYPVQPPLAMNPKLMASARTESLDMATHGFQNHVGSDGSTFSQRISNQGYSWAGAGENIYAYSTSAFFGHVGFNADWGVPSFDHRANIMNNESNYPLYREVGVSCVPTSVKGFGPMVITQDFGKPADGTVAYVLGVVYNDADGSGSYTQGEGLAGVTITLSNGSYYAVSATAGGFVVPLPATGSGTLTVTAAGAGLGGPRVKTIAWTAGTNVKVDFTTADPVTNLPVAPTVSTPKNTAPFFTGEQAVGNGVYYLAFGTGNAFGYYSYLTDAHYIYHFDLGYEYVFDANDGHSGVYLYDFKSGGFFYTSPVFPFPYLYDFSRNSVLYYYPNPSNPGRYNTDGVRWFYDCRTGQIISK